MKAHPCPKFWRDKTPLQLRLAIRAREEQREKLVLEATRHRPFTRSQSKKKNQTKEVSGSPVVEEESWTALQWVKAATRAVQQGIVREAMEEMPPGP